MSIVLIVRLGLNIILFYQFVLFNYFKSKWMPSLFYCVFCINLFVMNERMKKIIISFVVSILVSFVVFVSVFFARGNYLISGYCDAFFVSGVASLVIPLFIMLIRTGSFDVLNYGMYRFFESFRKDKTKRWDSALDYKNDLGEKRIKNKPVIFPYFVIASILLVVSIILLSIFYSTIN